MGIISMMVNGHMPLLLIPGFMLDETLWDKVAQELSRIGPLHYGSTREGASIDGMAEAIMRDAPERFILIGFSMGGYVAREIVRRFPDRVAALALIATSARADTPAQTARKAAALQAMAQGEFKGLSRSVVAQSLHPDRAEDHGLIAHIRSMSVNLGHDVFIRQTSVGREGDLGRLAGIAVPTLVIAAENDRLRSVEESRELAKGITGAELRVVPGCGHMIPLEKPDDLSALLALWLDRALRS
jgi:pimeloyl-ACP methyl ester carboxylesterase